MAATWQQIYEGETDANSPISQTLMDKIRENLDYLYQSGAQIEYFDFSYNNPGLTAWWTAIFGSSKDWRDRIVQVVMVAYSGNRGPTSTTGVGSLIPGNPNDHYWHTSIDVHGSAFGIVTNVNGDAILEEQLYTRLGVTNPGTTPGAPNEPYVSAAYTSGQFAACNVFCDSANWRLHIQANITGGATYREAVAQGRIIYSADRGAH